MRLGAYETVVELGRGGMATLFVARSESAEAARSLVFLKTLRPPVTSERISMFLDEARVGLLFEHANVVRTFDAGEENGIHYIALELLDGQSLDRILHRLRSVRTNEERHRTVLLWVVAESLAGLHYAHELRGEGKPLHIVHRDVTPHNLFVTYAGNAKVLDFGIARADGRISRTSTGEVKGKVRYMAPEQSLGLRIDRRADVFAAGLIVYEIVRGEPFWRPELPDREVFDELVGGGYPVDVPGASASINAILTKALARDASERYRSADEMRVELLAEIARRGEVEGMAAEAAAMLAELFGDHRDRMTKMVERAQRASGSPNAAPRTVSRTEATDVSRDGTIKRLLARFGLT